MIIGFVVAFIVLLLIYAVSYPKLVESKLELGMDKSEIIEMIASNSFDDTKDLHSLCTINKWPSCKAALSSGSSSFLTWSVGVDTFIVLGFDSKNKLIYKAYGDT